MIYLSNAFSLNMISNAFSMCDVRVTNLPMELVTDELKAGFVSAIGHQDTANILTGLMGTEVTMNRINVTLTPEDELYVAQYSGPRLEEGTTVLPEGAEFSFKRVYILQSWE